jgi:ElaB/YqjD/DUF883 family membrane-anchored ribosome-binding protein
MARSSSSKRSGKDEVCDELSFLHQENEELFALLDKRDNMLRDAKKPRKKIRALLEEVREKIAVSVF